MKLIVCPECSDVRALRQDTKIYCHCRKSSGIYHDNLHAEIFGEAIAIGFANNSFVDVLKNQKSTRSVEFKAFVIQKQCPTIKTPLFTPEKVPGITIPETVIENYYKVVPEADNA